MYSNQEGYCINILFQSYAEFFLRLSVHQQAFLSVVSLVGEWTSRYYISGYQYLLGGIYYTIKNLSGRIACIFFLKLKIFEKFYLGKHGYTINVYLEFTGVHIDCSFFFRSLESLSWHIAIFFVPHWL